jgi:hypothetical protein
MRPIAWLLVLAGLWSVGHGLFAHEPVGTVGVIIVLIGWALLTARGRAILFWIGQGVLTGLCLLTGLALAAFGGLLLLRYVEVVSASVRLTVRSALIPTLFLGSGLLLLVIGAHRLWRERGPLP